MSLFSGPEEHAANGPETWQVVKAGARSWHVVTADGVTLDRAETKGRAEALTRDGGFLATLWQDESRWYAGESVRGWRPWAVLLAEQEASERRRAERLEVAR